MHDRFSYKQHLICSRNWGRPFLGKNSTCAQLKFVLSCQDFPCLFRVLNSWPSAMPKENTQKQKMTHIEKRSTIISRYYDRVSFYHNIAFRSYDISSSYHCIASSYYSISPYHSIASSNYNMASHYYDITFGHNDKAYFHRGKHIIITVYHPVIMT